MKLKAFNKEKEYRKLQRNNKVKITYITSLFSVCVIAIVVTFILTNSFAFKSSDSFTLVDVTTKLVWDYTYTGTAQEFIVPTTGYYNIELQGASGYSWPINIGGKGVITKGIIYLETNTILYVYVGGEGNSDRNNEFNNAILVPGEYILAGGGGATDVRLVAGTNWHDSLSLRSRIMVAAGAGGGQEDNDFGTSGGDGGLLISKPNWTILGATQTTGYEFGTARPAYGEQSWTSGGGGYYGGLTTITRDNGYATTGGSSYISGYAGVNSILETGGTRAQPIHTNNTIHYSNKYFLNGKMELATNTGDGKAKITYIGKNIPTRTNTKLNNVRYIKSCINGSSSSVNDVWIELQVIKNGINIASGKNVTGTVLANTNNPYIRIVDGILGVSEEYLARTSVNGLQCITIDLGITYDLDEVVVWNYYDDGRTFYDNTLSVGSTSTSGTTSLGTVLHTYFGTDGYAEILEGKRYTAWD